jgi:serine/threonine protein kinase
MGTPHYIAPEQIETPGAIDHRVDLYSLGVVYYEMLTGELPLGRFEPPSRKAEHADSRLDEVVLRALEKDPNRRYQQANEIRTAVETAASQLQNFPTAEPPAPKAPRHSSFLRQFALMAGTALVAVFFYVLFKDHWPWRDNRPHRPPGQMDFTGTSDEPLLGKRALGALDLSKSQIQEVTRTVRRYQREFVVLERRHTKHTQDKNGHVHITVQPFPEDMDKLLTAMWKDLGAILNDDQITKAHTLNFERYFPNDGKTTVAVELWRDANGEEHFVESQNPGPGGEARPAPTLPPTMPPRYRFYLPDR